MRQWCSNRFSVFESKIFFTCGTLTSVSAVFSLWMLLKGHTFVPIILCCTCSKPSKWNQCLFKTLTLFVFINQSWCVCIWHVLSSIIDLNGSTDTDSNCFRENISNFWLSLFWNSSVSLITDSCKTAFFSYWIVLTTSRQPAFEKTFFY